MYRYDDLDRTLVGERVEQFRDQIRRRLSGELGEDEFRPLRLMNGLYLELHGYMLRVAIPYGTLSSRQMRALAHVARRYDRGYGHFTTRQNIQFNWPRLEDTPDILRELAASDTHAIQTSGSCIRNVTADQYAGAAADEIDDARVHCEIIRQWSTLHPEFSFLPRKFKIAVTAASTDRAAVRFHDIGLVMKRDKAGATGFEVLVGGGQGSTPMIAKTIREFVPELDLLSYLEAVLRVYNMLGRRDNKFKARIKIMVHEHGIDEVRRLVEDEWAQAGGSYLRLPQSEIGRIRAHFAPPVYREPAPNEGASDAARRRDPAFGRWMGANVTAHKQPGYAIVNVSLKPIGGIPGDATAEQMDAVANLADGVSFGEIRVTHTQNLVLPHVRRSDLYEVWLALRTQELAAPNIGGVTDIIACPGLDYCALANARSIPVAQRISERFQDLDRQHDLGELRLNISGCINACGHHHVGHVGILGVDRKGEEYYQITLGGNSGLDASIGKIVGPALPADGVTDAVETIVETYIALRRDGERFIDTYRRAGPEPFKESVYGSP